MRHPQPSPTSALTRTSTEELNTSSKDARAFLQPFAGPIRNASSTSKSLRATRQEYVPIWTSTGATMRKLRNARNLRCIFAMVMITATTILTRNRPKSLVYVLIRRRQEVRFIWYRYAKCFLNHRVNRCHIANTTFTKPHLRKIKCAPIRSKMLVTRL